MQKRVLAVHDISCVGKCSITVALPVLSAAGHECSILPTAVLSTHTGGFEGYTFRDLTDDMSPIADHWKSLSLQMDSIYTGYLGSFRQLELVKGLFADFRNENTVILVDPVMADNGKLYAGFSPEFPSGMREICSMADIIVPNLTEACLMLGKEYDSTIANDPAKVKALLLELSGLGPKKVILTGISLKEGELGAAGYDKEENTYCYYARPCVPGYFHGTGDVFASSLLGALLCDRDLEEALSTAVDFTVDSILRTVEAGTQERFGVAFEPGLAQYGRDLQ